MLFSILACHTSLNRYFFNVALPHNFYIALALKIYIFNADSVAMENLKHCEKSNSMSQNMTVSKICICWIFCLCIFSVFSVCFETDVFVSIVSKRARNTETNRKNSKVKKYVVQTLKNIGITPWHRLWYSWITVNNWAWLHGINWLRMEIMQ
jgi:hypothetical protein